MLRNINTWKAYRNALKRNIPYVNYTLCALMIHPRPNVASLFFNPSLAMCHVHLKKVAFSFALRVVESPSLNAENSQRLLTLVKTDGTQYSVKEHSLLPVRKDVEGKWLCGCEHVYREKRKQLCMRKKE